MNISELFDLHGKTVLITGGSGVLGRIMASGLAQAGVFVAVLGRREEPALAIAATIRAAGGEASGDPTRFRCKCHRGYRVHPGFWAYNG